jgi:hypothetical protein
MASSRFVKASGERLFLRLRIESNGFNVAIRMSNGLYRHMMKSQPTTQRSKALESAGVERGRLQALRSVSSSLSSRSSCSQQLKDRSGRIGATSSRAAYTLRSG